MPIVGAFMGFLFLSGAMSALPAHASAPTVPTMPVAMTGYNAVPEQTDDSPFETASGLYSNPETVAARSRDLADALPFGTVIEVVHVGSDDSCGYKVVAPSVGYRIIADTMNARYHDRIDILFDTNDTYRTADGRENASGVLGICKDVAIRVVGRIDLSRPGRVPQSQEELASFVRGLTPPIAVK